MDLLKFMLRTKTKTISRLSLVVRTTLEMIMIHLIMIECMHLPTLPHKQDVTQGQFLSGVQQV